MEAGKRLVVLASGRGSNLQAILDACTAGLLPARVVAVVSNQPAAPALERARAQGIPAVALPKPPGEDRTVYDARLADAVAAHRPDWVVLAGWMRLLTRTFLDRFPNQVVNLHPALPGAFPGLHAISRAWQAHQRGELTTTGVVVHRVVDEGVDNGPVLATATVPMQAGETLEALEVRVHQVEHHLLVSTLRTLCAGR